MMTTNDFAYTALHRKATRATSCVSLIYLRLDSEQSTGTLAIYIATPFRTFGT